MSDTKRHLVHILYTVVKDSPVYMNTSYTFCLVLFMNSVFEIRDNFNRKLLGELEANFDDSSFYPTW